MREVPKISGRFDVQCGHDSKLALIICVEIVKDAGNVVCIMVYILCGYKHQSVHNQNPYKISTSQGA